MHHSRALLGQGQWDNSCQMNWDLYYLKNGNNGTVPNWPRHITMSKNGSEQRS